MKNVFKVFLLLLSFFSTSLNAQSLSIVSVQPITTGTIGLFDKFEAGIQLSIPTFPNPYDPNIIDVSATFISPSGITNTVNGFWYQPYQRCLTCPDPTQSGACTEHWDEPDPNYLTPISTLYPWRIRFAPNEAGTWAYSVKILYQNNTIVSGNYSFLVDKSGSKGYVAVSKNNKNFCYKNTTDNIWPIGYDFVLGYNDISVYNRHRYLSTMDMIDSMHFYGGNLLRLWMAPSSFGIEWKEDGIGKYDTRQNRAFDLDDIIEHAKDENVLIQLTLDQNWNFFNNATLQLWLDNPYRTILASGYQNDFFTDANCISKFKQRLRYIIARWGYSTSILSYELFNEVDQAPYFDNNHTTFWDPGVNSSIRNWHDQIISYGKSLDKNHLFTTSVTVAACGNAGSPNEWIFGSPGLDYAQIHHYTNDFNSEFQYNYLTQRAVDLYRKPVFVGEFGSVGDCFIVDRCFDNPYNWYRFYTRMHNTFWSTAFSGGAASGLFWQGWIPYRHCLGGQYRYISALRAFLNNDFFNKNYKPIGNSCAGNGPKDDTTNSQYPSTDNCVPTRSTIEPINTNYYTSGVTTSNDKEIEVFALKAEDEIVGWVHNKTNYWYNMIHNSGCSDLDDNYPTLADVDVLDNETMTIDNLQCDGSYKIEFFSTYPLYDINNDGVNDEGGIIPAFTLNNVYAHCGSLTFTIPKMQALYVAPYAPDYGFRISKMEDFWKHDDITDYSPANGNMDHGIDNVIASAANQIFYKGLDERLHHLYTSPPNSWVHEWKTNWNDNSQNVGGDIVVNDDATHVFYQGVDGRLHHYYYIGNGQWAHEWKTDWNNNSQNVDGKIAVNADATNVFYRGVDARLHHYYYVGNGQWAHELMGGSTDLVGGGIDVDNNANNVYYQGTDNKLHQFLNLGNGQWQASVISQSSSENVSGSVSCSANGYQIFYKGTDNRLHHYYLANGQWNHEWKTNWNDNSQNVGGQICVDNTAEHVFFLGTDNYVHQYYYLGNGSWEHDYVICYDDLQTSYKVNQGLSYDGSRIFYSGTNYNVQGFSYNNGCNPRDQMKAPFNERKSNTLIMPSNSAIGTNELDNITVEIYPVPFENEINIRVHNYNKYSVELQNIQGVTVRKQVGIGELLSINTGDLPDGIYIANVKDEFGRIIAVRKLNKL